MRRIKDSIIESKMVPPIEEFGAIKCLINSSPGIHERAEAVEVLTQSSMRYYLVNNLHFDEFAMFQKVNEIINYFEISNYFYGISHLPAWNYYYEKNGLISQGTGVAEFIFYEDLKPLLFRYNPASIIMNYIYFSEHYKKWVLKMGCYEESLLFENESYVEYYKP